MAIQAGLLVVFFDGIVAVCLPGFIINIELRMTIFVFTDNHQDVFIEAIIRALILVSRDDLLDPASDNLCRNRKYNSF